MTSEQIWFTVLIGLLVNIVTGFATFYLTARRDSFVHGRDTQERNAEIAESAINHLNSSYLASKRLRIDVLSHLTRVRREDLAREAFPYILDGISRSLEQNRISILSNMLDWKHYLQPTSKTVDEMDRLRREELSTVSLAAEPVDMSAQRARPLLPQTSGQHVEATRTPRPDALIKSFAKPARSMAERIQRAIVEEDIEALKTLMNERLAARGPIQQIVGPAVALCQNEDPTALEALRTVWSTRLNDLKRADLRAMVGGIVDYHERTDTEVEGIKFAQEVADALLARDDARDDDKAYVLNQLGKMHFGAGQSTEAIQVTEQATQLNPSEPAYAYNLSVIHEELNDMERAEKWIGKCLELGSKEASHLSQAVEIFVKRGNARGALELFNKLEKLDEFRAKMLLLNEELRAVLQEAAASPEESA